MKKTLADRSLRIVIPILTFLYMVGWLVGSVTANSEAAKSLSAFG